MIETVTLGPTKLEIAFPTEAEQGPKLYEAYSNVWVLIKTKFPDVLQNRSNVDLKDKYRNLVKYGKIPLGNDGNETAGATDNDATDGDAMDG
ncbi:unnamed protein product [Phytophthora lilii]|uniref:Unnamed protein product n=1 Tax=Phytophthora lilii TaxID=2077276 RepID=A0A9W6U3J1_9STRA|nr:unnamed protein product [Phytophthora lilii]